jgi:hypothetical protein
VIITIDSVRTLEMATEGAAIGTKGTQGGMKADLKIATLTGTRSGKDG